MTADHIKERRLDCGGHILDHRGCDDIMEAPLPPWHHLGGPCDCPHYLYPQHLDPTAARAGSQLRDVTLAGNSFSTKI